MIGKTIRLLRRLLFRQLVLVSGLLIIWLSLLVGKTLGQPQFEADFAADPARFALPVAQVHPLPPVLAEWQDPDQQGDYFEFVEPSPAGYLIWFRFPVRVYIEPGVEPVESGNRESSNRESQWYEAVSQAVQEWNRYLPLTLTDAVEGADIAIWRSVPPIQRFEPAARPNQPLIDRLPRVRAAETRYQFEIQSLPGDIATLGHRFTISLSPNQTVNYTKATARHELGHALGIWGHSPNPTDALYFSQVRDASSISNRDVNTLKQIYQQPTHLGWALPKK
jgi:predicted Zn-dependent protease